MLESVFEESSGSPMQMCFSFIAFNLARTLENHNKSDKNHKIANEDFLESLRVDLGTRVILSHVLVEGFCCFYLSMLIRVF